MDEAAFFEEELSAVQAKLLAIECLANALLDQLDNAAKLAALEAACVNGQRIADGYRQSEPRMARALLEELQPMLSKIQAIRAFRATPKT